MKMLEGDTGKRVKWEDEIDSSWLGKYVLVYSFMDIQLNLS